MNSSMNFVHSVTKKLNLKIAFTLLLAIFLLAITVNTGIAEEHAEEVVAAEVAGDAEGAAEEAAEEV